MRTFICLGKVDVTKFWWPLCAKVVCFSSNPSRGGNKIICFIWSQINLALGVRSHRVDVLIITRPKTALNLWPIAKPKYNSTTYACIALICPLMHTCNASKTPLPFQSVSLFKFSDSDRRNQSMETDTVKAFLLQGSQARPWLPMHVWANWWP